MNIGFHINIRKRLYVGKCQRGVIVDFAEQFERTSCGCNARDITNMQHWETIGVILTIRESRRINSEGFQFFTVAIEKSHVAN